jgi:hypothetical protein
VSPKPGEVHGSIVDSCWVLHVKAVSRIVAGMNLTRPRLLLVPLITELEWVIRPRLEEWAEVATFDLPGVGDEPAVEPLDRQAVIDRALAELDRRGWDSYVLVCDGSALPTGVRVAHARRTRGPRQLRRWRSDTRASPTA